MTIKEVILNLKYLQEKYGNINIEKLMYMENVPFFIKVKTKNGIIYKKGDVK